MRWRAEPWVEQRALTAIGEHGDWLPAICAADRCIHLISGRIALTRTHIPHCRGEEATRMGPIYKTAFVLAQGWHGHHPSRAGRGNCPQRDVSLKSLSRRRLELRPFGDEPGRDIPPQRNHELARQGHDRDASDPAIGVAGTLAEPARERAVRLMAQP